MPPVRRLVAIAAPLLLLPTGCGDQGDDRIPPAASLAIHDITTTTLLAPQIATTSAPGQSTPDGGLHVVGEALVTASGNTVTLHAIQARAPDGRYTVDVEACAGPTAARIEGALFTIDLSGGSVLVPVQGVQRPALATADLQPGACARGWLSYDLPAGQAPVTLVFRGSSVIRWSLA